MCGTRRPVATNVVACSRYPAYLSGLRGLTADIAAVPSDIPTPYAPMADEDLSVVLRVDLNTNDFQVAGRKSVAELNAHAGRLRLHVWNLSPIPKKGSIAVTGGVLAGLPDEVTLPPMGEAAFDCTYAAQSGVTTNRELVLVGVFNGCRSSRLSLNIRSLASLREVCRTVEPVNWRNPKAWRRNTSADRFRVTWDETEQAIRFDAVWTSPVHDRWFYPVYDLTLPAESFEDVALFEFEVKSVQDKVENDFSRQYFMLVSAEEKTPAQYLDVRPASRGGRRTGHRHGAPRLHLGRTAPLSVGLPKLVRRGFIR